MPKDKYDALGPLLSEIGEEAVRIVGGDPSGVWLYVEAGEGWVGPSLFRDEGNLVKYFDPEDSNISELIMEARETEPDVGKRWVVMEYEIKGNTFDVAFKFSDEVDVEVDIDERRQAILKARYGDKPIVYPPLSDDAFEWTPDGR